MCLINFGLVRKLEDRTLNITHALDLLDPGESAIALRTDGRYLKIRNPDGSGSSGNWKISATRPANKVIIYLQLQNQVGADIYVANYVDTVGSPDPPRRILYFQDAELIGSTDRNWKTFAETNQNSVRHLRKPRSVHGTGKT